MLNLPFNSVIDQMSARADLSALQIGSHFGTFIGAGFALITSSVIVSLWMPGAIWGAIIPTLLLFCMFVKVQQRRTRLSSHAGAFATGLSLSALGALVNGLFSAALLMLIGPWDVVQQIATIAPQATELPGGLNPRSITLSFTLVSFMLGGFIMSPLASAIAALLPARRPINPAEPTIN